MSTINAEVGNNLELMKSKQEQNLKKGYVNIFQGQIGRYIQGETDSKVIGLYTDEITTCHIIIMFRKNRFSLIHADPSISLEDIQAEQFWAGEKNYVMVVKHKLNAVGLNLKFASIQHKVYWLPDNKDAITVSFEIGSLVPKVTHFNTSEEAPILFNYKAAIDLYATYKFNIMHNEIYGQLKINDLFKKRKAYAIDQNRIHYQEKTWSFEDLSAHFQKEWNYPKKRLLFTGIDFCNDREADLQLTGFALDTKNAILNKLKNKAKFKDLYMAFMTYFHEKESDLNSDEFQVQYDGQCTELARLYCYLNDIINLLEKEQSQAYWVKIIKRYLPLEILKPTVSNIEEKKEVVITGVKEETKLSSSLMLLENQLEKIKVTESRKVLDLDKEVKDNFLLHKLQTEKLSMSAETTKETEQPKVEF